LTEEHITGEAYWNAFIRRHLGVFGLFVAACIAAIIDAVYVFIWFTGNALTSGLAPSTLAQWTLGNVVTFIFNLAFWEIVFVGIPLLVGVGIAWWWWSRLPMDEKAGYRIFDGRRSRASGDGASFLFFIAFCLKAYLDGNWNTAISSWTFSYVVGSSITIFVWAMGIIGVVALIGFIWWITRIK
jgi:hypothetical protein